MLEVLVYLRNWFHREEGATMVEYGLMVAGVAIVVAVGAFALGIGVNDLFGRATACVGGAGAPC